MTAQQCSNATPSEPKGLLVVAMILCSAVGMMAQQLPERVRESAAAPHQVNASFFEAWRVYSEAGPRRPGALEQFERTAAERYQQLQQLVASDPAAVIAAALPQDVRDSLPVEIRGLVEQHVQLRGELEVAIEDGSGYSGIHYSLHSPGGRLTLYFTGPPATDLQTGSGVEIEGVQVGSAVALGTSQMTAYGSVAPLPSTFGVQKTLVILVNFQDEATQPVTSSYVSNLFFGSASSVSAWWMQNSFQQTWATGNVIGWYTIPVSSTACDTSAIAINGNAAAQNAGYVPGNYQHVVYIFPNNACTWWGYSTIGGSPSQSWIRDYTNSTSGVALMNLTHELGHSLGLFHSHGWNCTSYPSTVCSWNEYGDTLDVMGNLDYVSAPHYNGFQKESLGWLNYSAQPPIQTVSASGTYSLAPFETQDSGTKALKIPQSNGAYYYVEYRTTNGFDSFLSGNSNVLNGVVVHLATPGSANSSELFNIPSPSSETLTPALDVGQRYTDSLYGITIAPASVSGSSASVQITIGSSSGPCTHANPTMSITGPSGSMVAGAQANFTVAVTNNDSSSCAPSQFGLGYSVPVGWAVSYSASSLSLAPGGSASASFSAIAPSGTASGTYTVGTNTSNMAATSFTASTSASETIITPPPVSVSVSTNQSNYSTGQKVETSVSVMSGGSPVSGARVTVKITKSNAGIETLTGTTGSNGVAVLGYSIGKKDPAGTWQDVATYNGNSATTSFSVK